MLLRPVISRTVMQWRQSAIKYKWLSTGSIQFSFVRNKDRLVARWEENKPDNEARDVGQLHQTILHKLANGNHAAVTDLQMFIDGCTDPSNFPLLQKTLKKYRRSKSIPYDGLSSVVLRACVRLNRLNKAVDMIKDKPNYGIFPEVNGYNFLMDELMNPKRQIENAAELSLQAYSAMIADNIKPNKTSNALRIAALVKQGSEKKLKYGIKLYYEFMDNDLKANHVEKLTKIISYVALEQQQPDVALNLINDYINWNKYKPANIFCHLYAKSLKDANRESEILDFVEEHLKLHPTIKLKSATMALIREAVGGLENADLNTRLDTFEAHLQAEKRISDLKENI